MKTERTRLRRKPERGSHDKSKIYEILDAMPMCHIGFVDSFGTPAVMPTLGWREGNHYYWHASNGARSMKAMAGKPVAVTVSILDGFVLARAAMNHSANYRSVMLYGEAFAVSDPQAKAKRLEGMIESLYPGRWSQLRPITDIELKQTAVLGIEIDEGAAKVRAAGVGDDEEDLNFPCWSGVVPITLQVGTPIDDDKNLSGIPMGADVSQIKIG